MLEQMEYMLRIALAALCGFVIGMERKNRLKEAGTRTHLIVALGAALMMVLSKYAFFDLASYDFLRADASRIASQVVSGVGFLGAGMIFMRGQTVTGLTTAAGVWVTAGIGMALGAGMYSVGIFSTALVVVTQLVLHRDNQWSAQAETLSLRLSDAPDALQEVLRALSAMNIQVINMEVTKKKSGEAQVEFFLRLPPGFPPMALNEKMRDMDCVKEVQL